MVTASIHYRRSLKQAAGCLAVLMSLTTLAGVRGDDGAEFFELHVRPLLVAHCYECHSEQAGTREGGLLLDRERGWLQGGTQEKLSSRVSLSHPC